MSTLGSIQSVGRPSGPRRISLPGVLIHWETQQIETKDHGLVLVICLNRDMFHRFINSSLDVNKIKRMISKRLVVMNDGTEYHMAVVDDMQYVMAYQPDKIIVYNIILTIQQWDLIRSRMVKPEAEIVTILD